MSDTIISLAVLKANWEAKRASYIDNFNVLTAECLRRSPDDFVSSHAVRDGLENHFGLRLPLRTVDLVLRRAAKTGLVYRERGIYLLNRQKLDKIKFEEYKSKFISLYDRLISDLRMFVERKFSVRWSAEDAELTLHDYLNSSSFTLLQAIYKKTYVPLPKPPTKSQRFIFASYVNNLVDNQSDHINSLQLVLEGHMLAIAIFLPDPNSPAVKFQNTSVYFDTRFLIHALGYSGKSLKAPHQELLKILYESGANLCCFAHTADEMCSVLRGCAKNLSTGSAFSGYGDTFDYFLSKGFSESDVLLIAGRLEKDLRKIRIEIKEKPPFIDDYMIDEKKLEDHILSKINYTNLYALKRDVDSISAIARIRADHQARLIERCRAIFVTPNTALVQAVNEFTRIEEESYLAPLAISDWDLTNLIWLKKPLTAPDLPRKRLIADCYAAVQPSDSFRNRYIQEIEKLNSKSGYSPEDVFALRRSLEMQKLAMELTAGDEEAFTEGTVKEVIEVYHARIRSEERSAREAAEMHVEQLSEELKQQTAKQEARIAQIEDRAVYTSKILSGPVLVLLVFLAAFSLYCTVPSVAVPQFKLGKIPINLFASCLIFVLSLANWVWGTTLSRIRRRIEVKTEPYIQRLYRWMGGMGK